MRQGRSDAFLEAVDFHTRYEECVATCEFDSGQDRARTEARAWNEVAALWYRQLGTSTSGDLCAGCGQALGAEADALLLPHGERAHARNGYACILAYGRRWKREAVAGLEAIGIPTPTAIAAEITEDDGLEHESGSARKFHDLIGRDWRPGRAQSLNGQPSDR